MTHPSLEKSGECAGWPHERVCPVLCDNVNESGCFGHAHLAKVYLFLPMLAVVACSSILHVMYVYYMLWPHTCRSMYITHDVPVVATYDHKYVHMYLPQ